MLARRVFLLFVAYLAFDLADPTLPGAFSFDAEDSEIEEAVHVQRRQEGKEAAATRPAPPQRRVEPRDDARLIVRSLSMTGQPPCDERPGHHALHSYLSASALASPTEDH